MTARDEIFHAMSFGPCSPNAARELLDRIEKEAQAAAFAEAAEALRDRAGELSELADEKMNRALEERAQEWHEAAEKVARLARRPAGK